MIPLNLSEGSLKFVLLMALALLTQAVETTPQMDLWDIAIEADVRSGQAWVESYSGDLTLIKRMISEHQQNFAGSACQFTFTVGKKYSFGRLVASPVNDEAVFKLLKRYLDTGEIKTALAMEWDGVSGDEDECEHYQYRFMAKHGNMLVLEYDLSEE